jgi:hypothetical protein
MDAAVKDLMNYGVMGSLLVVMGLFIWRWVLPRADALVSALIDLVKELRLRLPMQCQKLDEVKALAEQNVASLNSSHAVLLDIKDSLHRQTETLKNSIDAQSLESAKAATLAASAARDVATLLVKHDSDVAQKVAAVAVNIGGTNPVQ